MPHKSSLADCGPVTSQNITIAILNRYNLLLSVQSAHQGDQNWKLPSKKVNSGEPVRKAVESDIVGKLGVSRADLVYFDCIYQSEKLLAFRFSGEDSIINDGMLKSPMSYNWQWLTTEMLLDRCAKGERAIYQSALQSIEDLQLYTGL